MRKDAEVPIGFSNNRGKNLPHGQQSHVVTLGVQTEIRECGSNVERWYQARYTVQQPSQRIDPTTWPEG